MRLAYDMSKSLFWLYGVDFSFLSIVKLNSKGAIVRWNLKETVSKSLVRRTAITYKSGPNVRSLHQKVRTVVCVIFSFVPE